MAWSGFLRALRATRPTEDPKAALLLIDGFWDWWRGVREDVADDVAHGRRDRWTKPIGSAVAKLHPELEWDLVRGDLAEHCLVVSSGGDPALRTLAERWHRSGPPTDLLWEHRPARPAASPALWGTTLGVDGAEVDLARVVMAAHADDERRRLDVSVHHPTMTKLSEEARYRLAFLCSQWALGEDEADRWLGRVEPALSVPFDPLPPASMGPFVAQLQLRWGADPAREVWARVTGRTTDGAPLAGAVRYGIHRVDFPLFDEHIELRLPYPAGPEGLPVDEQLAQASASWCERLAGRVGSAAVMLARLDGEGRSTVHLYGDRLYSVVGQIEALLPSWQQVVPGAKPTLRAVPDPAWAQIEGLLP
ncbi:MAG: hypothetical protein U0Q15_19515 [Kineosporiaceae bacterium]